MWDIKAGSNIVQIELGSRARSAFSSRWKKEAELLMKYISEIRAQLEKDNIFLPDVKIFDAPPDIPPDDFIIYFGAFFWRGNCKKDDIRQMLLHLAYQHKLEDNSYNGIRELFQRGVGHLEEKNYQKAIYEFAKSYYWASFGAETLDIMINSIINIGGIEFLNQQYDKALACAQRACVLAAADNCYNPYIKYYAAAWAGVVYMQKQDLQEAAEHFMLAYNVISPTNENGLKISVLSTVAQLYMQMEDFFLSAEAVNKILDILQEDKSLEVENDFIIQLARHQANAYKAVIKQQELAYAKLCEEYEKLSQSFCIAVKEGALNFSIKHGTAIAWIAVGSFLFGSGDNQLVFGKADDVKQVTNIY